MLIGAAKSANVNDSKGYTIQLLNRNNARNQKRWIGKQMGVVFAMGDKTICYLVRLTVLLHSKGHT